MVYAIMTMGGHHSHQNKSLVTLGKEFVALAFVLPPKTSQPEALE